jgi:hypothetical protein
MRRTIAGCTVAMLCLPLAAALHAQDAAGISRADRVSIFKAAGASPRGSGWVICGDDPQTAGANLQDVRDLNGDGRPEAVVVEDGTFCHGHAGTGYVLLSRQGDGRWKRMDAGSGVPEFLESRGKDGWPDLSVGGPGFCFPVLRWNGREYALHRREYEGRRCDVD